MTRDERQDMCINKWVANKCRGTIVAATGFGKTTTTIKAIKRFLAKNPNQSVRIVVPTDAIQTQWVASIVKNNLHNYNIKVEIINTASKIVRAVALLVVDEVHKSASETFVELYKNSHPKMILGLTATYERLDGREKLIYEYCPVIDTIPIDLCIKNGWLSEYTEYKVMLDVDLAEYNELNRQFLDHFSFFNYDFGLAMECVGGKKIKNRIVTPPHLVRYEYAKRLCTLSKDHPRYYDTVKDLNSQVTVHTFGFNRSLQGRKKFVMNHPKKIEIAELILSYRKDSKAITFNSTISQCEKYKKGYVIHSGKSKKVNRLTLDEFKKITKGVAHSSKSLVEGLDVPGLSLAIICHNTSSSTERVQKIGRAIRKEDNKIAEVFSLILRGTMEEGWFKKSSKNLKHVEINEDELIKILENKTLENKVQKEESSQVLFRF